MALVVVTERPFLHPTEKLANGEPAQFVLRLPLTAGDFLADGINSAKSGGEMTLRLIERTLVRWPYPEPITWENIGRLDPPTTRWLSAEIGKASNLSDDEGNASGSSSPATTAPGVEPSQQSSGIS